ncbi:alcohol dehydrogenase catalytic domain-containing protein [Leucobacter rhizosphaerae]|uniref:Alcohol dehydrogenase catalytic domain-containing protein n=1 Tax=Leucobacter rhizosphaerae TaxID=2932245 RepID=A0ABY4FRZ8_9MICO|nr:alcohol dehydrogenase catalytic domain-containing protein [Leucobacter rhizosphaerae]UOQ59073.1 alcohol dehydrogenase catalytic domain-containing protein [Leucobacter rhizosphaerae]
MQVTAQAAVVERLNGRFEVQEVAFDRPIAREVLVEVRAAGLCHSDLNVAGIDRGRSLPLIAGHELAGVVVEVGPEVRGLRVGDHVIGTEVRACGTCARCASGRPTLCEIPDSLERDPRERPRVTRGGDAVHTLGVSAFAGVSLADERQFVAVPAELPFPQASLLACGITTGLGAVDNVARVQEGETVAVFGLGGVGLSIVIGAVLAGARTVIAIDIDPAKLELARRLGATHVVTAADGETTERMRAVAGSGVDHTFDAVGIPEVTISAIASTARGGTCYLIGIPKPGPALAIDTMRDLIGAQRGIRGVYMGGTVPCRDLPRYASLALEGRLPLDLLISERIGIAEINRAYAEPANGGARAVITDFSAPES